MQNFNQNDVEKQIFKFTDGNLFQQQSDYVFLLHCDNLNKLLPVPIKEIIIPGQQVKMRRNFYCISKKKNLHE